MARESVNWLLAFSIAFLIVVMGIQGSLGKVLACILVPSKIDITSP